MRPGKQEDPEDVIFMHFFDRGGADILEKGIKGLVKHNVIVVAPRRVQNLTSLSSWTDRN